MISVRRTNRITLLDDQKTVSIGMGAKWMAVYNALEPDGLAVTGGYFLGVWLSFQHCSKGFACMNVMDYEIRTYTGKEQE